MLFLHFVEVSTHGKDEGGGGEDEGGGGEDEGGGGGDATHVTSQPVSSVGQSTAERVL